MRARFFSNYNLDNLRAYLDARGVFEEITTHQLAEWMPGLGDPANRAEHGYLWVSADQALPEAGRMYAEGSLDRGRLRQELDSFLELVERAAARFDSFTLFEFAIPFLARHDDPVREMLAEINAIAAERLDSTAFFHLAPLVEQLGARQAVSSRSWLMAKMPYGLKLLQSVGDAIAARVHAMRAGGRKLVIVDLDQTLWGGILGDDGVEGIRLGGHDALGEAYVAFQQELKRLRNRGILLAVSSKNDRVTALGAIDSHPEMVLRREDFCALEIDWTDKADHVARIISQVNIGPQSVVFLDDNPAERGRVREAHPEVLVPEMPDNPIQYCDLLRSLDGFDFSSITEEDRRRTQMIRENADRDASRGVYASLDEWLASLSLRVTIEPLGPANLARAAQLLNKTNQMNLRTRRMDEAAWLRWAEQEGHEVHTFRVADRFGDSGLTGILGLRREGEEVYVEDFVLSCRVFGKQVEEVMLAKGTRRAAGRPLVFDFLETPKNAPCRSFLDRGYLDRNRDRYTFDAAAPFPVPAHVEVTGI